MRAELHRACAGGGSAADDAAVALGAGPVSQRLRSAIRALAQHRGHGSSICPSDAARAVGGKGWRDLMADATAAARELARDGSVSITQGGRVIDPDADWRGPIRIRTCEPPPAP